MIGEWIRAWRMRRRLRRRIADEIAFHVEQASRERQAQGWRRSWAVDDALRRFGDRRRIARECVSALEEQPPAWGGFTAGASRGAIAAAALATPLVLAWLLIPHHLRPLPGRAPDQLLISKQRAVAAFYSSEQDDRQSAAFQRAAAVVSRSGDEGLIRAGLSVSSNFFEMQGVEPQLGHGFSGAAKREIVLSDRLWRSEFGADRGVVGRSAMVDGEPIEIVAVMPPHYWFLTPGHSFWIHAPRGFKEMTAGTLLARRLPSESLADAEERVASRSMFPLHTNGLVGLEQTARMRLTAAAAIVKAGLLLLALLGAVQVWSLVRSQCRRPPRVGILIRYYLFLFAKAAPVTVSLAILWLGAWDSGVALSGYFGDIWAFLTTFLFALSSVAVVWQSLVDQRLRCHVCLRKLAMPLPTGVIGSVLFDAAATEYICAHGHGTLRVPHPALEQLQPPLWREPEGWCLELWGSAMRG